MPSSPAVEPVSLAAYLGAQWEPEAEYVDGAIEERPMGEREHAAWQKAILQWFLPREREWNVCALPELRVQVAPARFRVPDVAVLDAALPYEAVVTRAPLAVFEILSPEDSMARMLRKLADYAAMGVAQIWVIDPDGPRYWRFVPGGLVPARESGTAGEAMHLRLDEIAALLPPH